VTNFEKCWAWFFSLIGWQWKYFPQAHGFSVEPSFRVCVPCGHSECSGSHMLDVFLRRGVNNAERFGVSIFALASLCRGSDSPYDSPHPALFGENPSVTIWEMAHGCGGGEYSVPVWVPDWKDIWARARSLTRSVATPPVGRLR
jgi:hypothetical protein